MWIVEIPSNGTTRTLKVNTIYKVGRKVTGDSAIVLAGKYVSRDHSTIQIERKPGGRSTITITDNKTKAGTYLGETRIKDKMTVEGNPKDTQKFTVVFGKADAEGNSSLVFKYQPMGLVYSTSDKTDSGQSYKDKIHSLIGDLDFDVLADFPNCANWTVYFVKSNRNTSKTLVALVRGIPIVTLDFVKDASESLKNSHDFQKDLPDPTKYLPEPAMAIDDRRKACFDGMTFIFADRDQFDSMIQPITGAGGQVQFYNIQAGLQARPLLDFVEKNDNGLLVKVARPANNNVSASTINRVLSQVSHSMGVEPVDQKRFLDAILKCDPSLLKVHHHEQPASETTRQSPSIGKATRSDSGQQPNISAKPKNKSAEIIPADPPPHKASPSSSIPSSERPQEHSETTATTTTRRRKRREHSQTIDFMDFMLGSGGASTTTPSQENSADRHEENANARNLISPVEASSLEEEPIQNSRAEERPRKRARMSLSPVPENESEQPPLQEQGQEQESIHTEMTADKENEAPIEELRDLGIEESFPVIERQRAENKNQRWNSKWNGRNNFKGFRRRDRTPTTTKMLQEKEYIPLVEQEPPDYGLNDHAWFNGTVVKQNKRQHSKSPEPPPITNSKVRKTRPEQEALFVGLSEDEEEDQTESIVPNTREEEEDDDDDDDVDGLRLRFRRNR